METLDKASGSYLGPLVLLTGRSSGAHGPTSARSQSIFASHPRRHTGECMILCLGAHSDYNRKNYLNFKHDYWHLSRTVNTLQVVGLYKVEDLGCFFFWLQLWIRFVQLCLSPLTPLLHYYSYIDSSGMRDARNDGQPLFSIPSI